MLPLWLPTYDQKLHSVLCLVRSEFQNGWRTRLHLQTQLSLRLLL